MSTYIKDNSNIGVSVSLCIFCFDQGQKKVLIVNKKREPFKNGKILPHQMLKPNQSFDDVCNIILQKNIGNNNIYIEQLNVFGNIYRHPKGRIIDVSFYGLVNLEKDDINGFAKIIIETLKNKKIRNELGTKGYTIFKSKFTAERMSQTYIDKFLST